jgi:tRNA (cmo5U34)-methyltransferase
MKRYYNMTDFTFAHRQEGFDSHIDMSIRGYSALLDDVVSLSRYFVEGSTNVVDIGCSTGKLTQRIHDHNKLVLDVQYVGVEIAEGFSADLEDRKKSLPNASFLHPMDIRDYSFENCSLVTSLFTLQFMPYSCRKEILQRIYDGLNTGSAFIFGEKVDTTHSRIENMMRTVYYEFKNKSFDYEDIMKKELTLQNMLKPNSWKEIEDMLNEVGFKAIQSFWQNHLFMGAIAIK